MFRWTLLNTLLIFDFLLTNNCISLNSSSDILPTNNTFDDDLINLDSISKINENNEKPEEDKEEYAYGKDAEVGNSTSEVGNNTITQIGNNTVEAGNNTYQLGNNISSLKESACQFDISLFGLNKPLLRNPQTRRMLLPYRTGTTVITLQAREHMILNCPGTYIVTDARNFVLSEAADATCFSGNLVRIDGNLVNFATVRCADVLRPRARFMGKRCWNNQGKEIEVGFLFHTGRFLEQYKICFDEATKKVIYSVFPLLHQIEDQQTILPDGALQEVGMYKLKLTLFSLFTNDRQRITINRQIGLPDSSTKYIRPIKGNQFYLTPGYLTPKADFMYPIQQAATMFYINTVPMWHSLKVFNWAALEANIRTYSERRGVDLIVMTGGYKTALLPHERTSHPVPLHMYVDGNFRAVPIPAQIWKIVYSPSTKHGIAFLALNNPYITYGPREHICPDVFNDLGWVTLDRNRHDYGYMYACTIADLKKVIPEIPDFLVRQWLV